MKRFLLMTGIIIGATGLFVLLLSGEEVRTQDVVIQETPEVAAMPQSQYYEVRPPRIGDLRRSDLVVLNEEKQHDVVLVTRVVDGDTIEIEGGEKVRYIGVNTPESVDPRRPVQCFGKEASAYNKKLVEGQRVRLEPDVEDRDKYHRLLRYVWLGDTMMNEQLMQDGYAQVMTIPPNVKYVELFKSAQTVAREKKIGLWAKCKK